MKNLESRLKKYRRYFHKHPEISDKEFKTQQYIYDLFKNKNCFIKKIKNFQMNCKTSW